MLEETLKKTVSALTDADIKIALAGGFAYSLYCEPRATVDVDLVLLTGSSLEEIDVGLRETFVSVYRNLETIEFPLLSINRFLIIEDEEETVLDILNIKNEEYAKAVAGRIRSIELEEIKVPVVSPEDLYLLKQSSGREQDRLDAARIEEHFADSLDHDYINRWREKLL
jgi:predicted nucleotidyltransferase